MRLYSRRRGRWLFAALLPVLPLLGGCHVQADVTIDSAVTLGHLKVDAARIVARGDRVRFTCMHSRSGACYFKVAAAHAQQPASIPGSAFRVAVGESRELEGLPKGFRHCLDYTGTPRSPSCAL